MAQPIWQTPTGSLGVIPESQTYVNSVVATDPDSSPVEYRVIAGFLPDGIQFLSNGRITGIPIAVNENTTSRFTVRASTQTLPPRIADRTFSLTVTGNNTPAWVTASGSIGNFYTTNKVDFQFEWTDNDPSDTVVVTVASGGLPGVLVCSTSGHLS